MNTPDRPKPLLPLGLCMLLVAAIWVCYGQVRGHSFVDLDDPQYITENPYLRGDLGAHSIVWAFTTGYFGNWHPLTWVSYMADIACFGIDAGGHLIVNVILHAITSALVLVVFCRMTGSVWRSTLVAGLFALHPLHVESVAWVSERKDVLSGLFAMLTIGAYVAYVRQPRIAWYATLLTCFALGLLSKPMLVTLPFVLALLNYWPLRRFESLRAARFRRPALELLPLLVMAVAVSVVTIVVQERGGAMRTAESIPLSMRLSNATVSYVNYLAQSIWPSKLAVYYPYPESLPIARIVAAGVVLAGITAAVVALGRQHRHLLVGWLWFLGMLVPVIGIIQVGEQARADRYMYLPLIGLAIMAAWSIPEVRGQWNQLTMKTVSTVSLGFLIALSVVTCKQVGHWENTATLYQHTLNVTQRNFFAHFGLGRWWLMRGELERAEEHLRQAIAFKPDHADAFNNLGLVLENKSALADAEAAYRQAIAIKPDSAEALSNLGNVLARGGRFDEAVRFYQHAIELGPSAYKLHANFGEILLAAGRVDEAIASFETALQIKPDLVPARVRLANILYLHDRIEQAIAHYEQALRYNPHEFEAHNNAGVALMRMGRSLRAAEHFRQALRIKPDYAPARANLAKCQAALSGQ
jgi:tetratricopeptide (TPR) repeat protein